MWRPEVDIRCFLQLLSSLISKAWCFVGLELADSARQAVQEAPLLSLSSQSWDCRLAGIANTCHHAQLLCGRWLGIKLKSSCLYGKHFIAQAISSALSLCFRIRFLSVVQVGLELATLLLLLPQALRLHVHEPAHLE